MNKVSIDVYTKEMKEYIDSLKSVPPEEAKKRALANLIKMGIINKDGTPKKQIVNGDFFGW